MSTDDDRARELLQGMFDEYAPDDVDPFEIILRYYEQYDLLRDDIREMYGENGREWLKDLDDLDDLSSLIREYRQDPRRDDLRRDLLNWPGLSDRVRSAVRERLAQISRDADQDGPHANQQDPYEESVQQWISNPDLDSRFDVLKAKVEIYDTEDCPSDLLERIITRWNELQPLVDVLEHVFRGPDTELARAWVRQRIARGTPGPEIWRQIQDRFDELDAERASEQSAQQTKIPEEDIRKTVVAYRKEKDAEKRYDIVMQAMKHLKNSPRQLNQLITRLNQEHPLADVFHQVLLTRYLTIGERLKREIRRFVAQGASFPGARIWKPIHDELRRITYADTLDSLARVLEDSYQYDEPHPHLLHAHRVTLWNRINALLDAHPTHHALSARRHQMHVFNLTHVPFATELLQPFEDRADEWQDRVKRVLIDMAHAYGLYAAVQLFAADDGDPTAFFPPPGAQRQPTLFPELEPADMRNWDNRVLEALRVLSRRPRDARGVARRLRSRIDAKRGVVLARAYLALEDVLDTIAAIDQAEDGDAEWEALLRRAAEEVEEAVARHYGHAGGPSGVSGGGGTAEHTNGLAGRVGGEEAGDGRSDGVEDGAGDGPDGPGVKHATNELDSPSDEDDDGVYRDPTPPARRTGASTASRGGQKTKPPPASSLPNHVHDLSRDPTPPPRRPRPSNAPASALTTKPSSTATTNGNPPSSNIKKKRPSMGPPPGDEPPSKRAPLRTPLSHHHLAKASRRSTASRTVAGQPAPPRKRTPLSRGNDKPPTGATKDGEVQSHLEYPPSDLSSAQARWASRGVAVQKRPGSSRAARRAHTPRVKTQEEEHPDDKQEPDDAEHKDEHKDAPTQPRRRSPRGYVPPVPYPGPRAERAARRPPGFYAGLGADAPRRRKQRRRGRPRLGWEDRTFR